MQALIRRLADALRRPPSAPSAPSAGGNDEATDYARRAQQEVERFAAEVDVHALPEIFHYWSNRYLRPVLESFGFSHPDDFFARQIEAVAARTGRRLRITSIGAGNGDTEIRVAKLLRERGVGDFRIECLDLNPAMLARGAELAAAEGMAAHVGFLQGDFNHWRPEGRHDVVMANQSLHHVVELESLFDAVHSALADDGAFITSDMIGRNGHQRWPEALSIVQEFWRELPRERRWNLQLRRHEDEFLNWDCSAEGFEGIRAQDILPLLVERFGFETFIAYGNVIDPFIDRSFGHHFDAASEADRAFIDRVHARDEAEILAGRIKPTHMMAVLRRDRGITPRTRRRLTPIFCIRDPMLEFLPATGQDDDRPSTPDLVAEAPAPSDAHAEAAPVHCAIRTAYDNGHFYSPVVDPAEVAARADAIWPAEPVVPGIDFDDASHRRVLEEWFPRHMPAWDYPEEAGEAAAPDRFFTRNSQFSWLDCRTLFVLLQEFRPRRMIEVGSGFSSLLTADVNRRFLDRSMDVTCIEPYPRSFLRSGIDGIDRLLEAKVQDVPLQVFSSLQDGDVLFIDSSHVVKTGSDVNHLFLEVLPRISRGVLVHVHDIFLPHDYPRDWVVGENRSWNEQYLLQAMLAHSSAFDVVFGCSYAFHRFPDLVAKALAHPRGHAFGGGSIWIRRR